VPERELTRAGLDAARLFVDGPVAFRRAERVTATHVEVDGARVPRALIGPVTEGQWLRFSKAGDGRVEVRVDLRATLDAEARMCDLFERLTRR
jgi:hypothetical protein